MIKVSLVLASYNRSNLLDLSLASIVRNKPMFPLEIIVVNDGQEDDTKTICEKYQKELNIRYFFTGQRNQLCLIPRCPSYPNNFAIRQATGDIVILTNPEIYHLNKAIDLLISPLLRHPKRLCIPTFIYFDNDGEFTERIKNAKYSTIPSLEKRNDYVKMPFLLACWKKELLAIGGYDEDFIGYASEDNDLIQRLLLNKCDHYRTRAEIVHLYHGPRCPHGMVHNNPAWIYNRRLLMERKDQIVRNKGEEWGTVHAKDKGIFTKEMITIPKILHLYWDRSPMSWLQTQTILTFHRKNPDWDIRIYLPIQSYVEPNGRYVPDYVGIDYFYIIEELSYVILINVDLAEYGIDPTIHSILQSDIFRYKIMYEYGGVWSDFDVLWLKSMTYFQYIPVNGSVPISCMGTFVCRYNKTEWNNVSILISIPKHPLYLQLIKETDRIQKGNTDSNKLSHQTFGSDLLDRVYPTQQIIEKEFFDVVDLPYKTFYPYAITNIKELYKEVKLSRLDTEVMAIHWFNGHALSKAYVMEKELLPRCSMSSILTLINKGIL